MQIHEYEGVEMESHEDGGKRVRTDNDYDMNDRDDFSGGFAAASGFQQVRDAW